MSRSRGRPPIGRPSVLLVDDRPDKLLALEAALVELDVDLVSAGSGREALRHVLQREFAAILLDVNMPGMDGFETASLIRQRPTSEKTPIIFVTGYSEDLHVARGYSLGAVDYIVSPIVPEVLRTKVSVFIDLHVAVQQLRQHAQTTERHAERLQQLARASQDINSAASLDGIADRTLQATRDIVGGGAVFCGVLLGDAPPRAWRLQPQDNRSESTRSREVIAFLQSMRASIPEGAAVDRLRIGARPNPLSMAEPRSGQPDLEALMAPLVGHAGRSLGLLYLAPAADGSPFDEDDEALLAQIGQLTGIAIENLLFSQEHEANRLKEEFLSTLSHELRTPLTAIFGWVRLLKSGRLDEKAFARALEVIERNVKVQNKLIDDLLDISRIAAGKLKLTIAPVAIRELLAAAVETARPMAERQHVTLTLSCDSGVERIPGDADRLQQVAWNLLTNAIKFTPEGGHVDVRLASHASTVTIQVTDSGRGISADFLPHVFERFRQADSSSTRRYGGLGLGLAVVLHIVELHGGTVTVQSPGENLGSVFTVVLPSVLADSPGSSVVFTDRLSDLDRLADDAPRPTPIGRDIDGIRVLAVDDDPDTRHLFKKILGMGGADVMVASSASEALRCVEAQCPDVLVSDIAMPGDDGWHLLAQIRHRFPSAVMGAIAVSAYVGEAERTRSRVAGFDAHVGKPIDPSSLVAAVSQSAAAARGRAAQDASGLEGEARTAVSSSDRPVTADRAPSTSSAVTQPLGDGVALSGREASRSPTSALSGDEAQAAASPVKRDLH